jgi:hypothetical protein
MAKMKSLQKAVRSAGEARSDGTRTPHAGFGGFEMVGGARHPIKITQGCKWQRIGKGSNNYAIGNDGPGTLEIFCGGTMTEPPDAQANPPRPGNKISPDLEPGQSTHVDRNDCGPPAPPNDYVWVHAVGDKINGYWVFDD